MTTKKPGLSLLKKLGFSESDVQQKEKEPELKIRPKQAGLSEDIDGIQGESPTFESVGAWRIDGPSIPAIKNLRLIKPQTQFCKSATLLPLQTSICRFHEQFEQHKTNTQLTILKEKAESLERKIESLNDEKNRIEETTQTRKEFATLLQRFHEIPSDYNDAFKLVKLLAKNPSLVALTRPKYAKYQKEKKNPFEVPQLSMIVSRSYSSSLFDKDIYSTDHHTAEWEILKDFLYEVQKILSQKSKNTQIDKLWVKFLRKVLFPKLSAQLYYETSDECANWANVWFERGLLSESNLLLFFVTVGKPFLVKNLQLLCRNFKIHGWIELAQTPSLSSQFGVIVRLHADGALQKWTPPSPFAIELLQQWPYVLGNSLDFMYTTVAPKLMAAVSFGNIDALIPWLEILPSQLSTSIIADSYMKHYLLDIESEMKKDKRKAALTYNKMKSGVPQKYIKHPKIMGKFIDALDMLKEANSILKGIKIERDPEPSTVGDLLEDISAKLNLVFMSRGTFDGRTAYSIGEYIFGVLDGVLFLQKDKNWIPIFVKDIVEIVKK